MSKVSIVIVHYNTTKYTKACLESLEHADFRSHQVQVIVVDNASDEVFSASSSLDLRVLRNDQNEGFSGGNNVGIRYALTTNKAEYVLLLNSDTTVSPNFLTQLLDCAASRKKIGAICPKIYFEAGSEFFGKQYSSDERGKVIWFAGGSIDWQNMIAFHRGVDEVDRGQFEFSQIKRDMKQIPLVDYQTMEFATGCCVLIPASVLLEVGMFDESFFLYWEDTDLSMRIRMAGYNLYFCPNSVIWHKNAGSTGGSGSRAQISYQERNRLKFAMRYAPIRTQLALCKKNLSRALSSPLRKKR